MFRNVMSTSVFAERRVATWTIVDCRFDLQREDWGHDQYLLGHIPGAIYAHLGHDLSTAMTGTNGRHPWPSPEEMTATFSRMGIASGTQVVVYDQDVGMFASRLWWMLRSMGHEAVAVLDGGWARWTHEGRPTSRGEESRAAAAFVPAVRPGMVVSAADVAALGPGTLLVDARAPERFEGRSEPLDRVAGHIPGAVNRFFKKSVSADGTLLPPHEIRADFEQVLGGHAPADTIMYCGSGVTACHNLLALDYAGLPGARLYPGSWSEWCADPSRPVATGP